MILLRDLLAEITLGHVEPYARQFTWTPFQVMGQTYFKCSIEADGHPVEMNMSPVNTQHAEREYIFVFRTRDKWGASTHSHESSVAKGHVDYLRLILTVGEAILDFCAQHAPEAIDITGGDKNPESERKKNRIYAALLQHNASRLMQAGYTSLRSGDSLWIVRKQDADATGVVDD